MTLHVVLYAEGGAELGGPASVDRAPTSSLESESLGPAHVLLARAIAYTSNVPREAIHFFEPLRTSTGMRPRGSDLHDPRTLRRVMSWPPHPARRPHLAVLLVDEDEVTGRLRLLQGALRDLSPTPRRVVGVAVREFESWLITDFSTVAGELGLDLAQPQNPESLRRGEAKQMWNDWRSRLSANGADEVVRRRVCESCRLDVLERASRSFALFLGELREATR